MSRRFDPAFAPQLSVKEIVELHGDQLYGWFKEKFPKHKDALTRKECRAIFKYTARDVLRAAGAAR